MATPPTTPTSALPTERLNKIAAAKLATLGLTVRLAADQKTLTGELALSAGKVLHPVSRTPIAGSKFAVVGHDCLSLIGPPLAALGPIMFYDATGPGVLEERLAAALHRRMAALAAVAEKLKRLRIPHGLDAEQLQVVAEVAAAPHTFELRGGPEGIWVSRIRSLGGATQELPAHSSLVDLTPFKTPVDLEMYLTSALPSLQGHKTPAPAAAPPAAGLEAVAAAPGALTLALLAQKLGPDAVFGHARPGEVTQNFSVGKVVYRFTATQVSGTTFSGTLTSSTGEKKWSDKFELLRFPGIAKVVASVLDTRLQAPASSPAPAPSQEVCAPVPSHLVPQLGEVWVMNVIIEREDQDEVRYACTNVDGKPFGATRLLKSNEFREVFVQAGTGWRLLILVEEVGTDNTVVYRQLDSRRQPRGSPKRIACSILVTNFVPEATAY